MKQPWWLINSILILLALLTLVFMFVARPKLPARVSFQPSGEMRQHKREITKIDLAKIYANDLFDTYKAPVILPPEAPESLTKPLPPPPIPKIGTVPQAPPPRFLEPLAINLKGIVVGSDERLDVAIIESTKEGKSKNYRLGDKIEDAQLIKIFKNKIILIRANGQQETLYVNQYDAELEQLLSPRASWDTIIKKVNESQYLIDPDLFVERVENLAQFIDLFNITTVYQQGISIGCRIGKMQQMSPGFAMGILPGDIIQEINGISCASVNGRVEIYEHITNLNPGSIITVKLLRKNVPISLFYKLERMDQNGAPLTHQGQEVQVQKDIAQSVLKEPDRITVARELGTFELEKERVALRNQQDKYRPTLSEHNKHEKRIMLSQKPQRSLRGKLQDSFERKL
jgi:type II secretory pathway component PulC